MAADPYKASGGPSSPISWNRYSYTGGDPVNLWDPMGLAACAAGSNCVEVIADAPQAPYDWVNLLGQNPDGDNGYGGKPPFWAESGSKKQYITDLQEAKKTSFSKDVSDCVLSSVSDHFGLTALTGLITALSQPVPKDMLPPYRTIGDPNTNLLSVLGYYVNITVPVLLDSNNLFRIVGRAGGYIAGAALAVDAAIITADSYQCYKNKNP